MSHRLISNLTAALLAMHTVLGCCWHHAHAGPPDGEQATSVESPAEHAGHDADCCNRGDSEPGHDRGTHVCQKGSCVFVGTGKVRLNAADGTNLASFVSLAGGWLSSPNSATMPLFAAGALPAPLRLHLTHQVLLL
jgi:hypothetical protein